MLEILIILFVAIMVFWPTLRYQMIVDDIRHLDAVQKGALDCNGLLNRIKNRLYGAGTLAHMAKCGTCQGNKRLPTMNEKTLKEITCPTCKGSGKAWRIDLIAEHAFTLGLHALICVLIYFALGRNQISFLTALLYLVHPANTQTSVWMNGRRYAINIALMLIMLCLGPIGLLFWLPTIFLQVNVLFAPVLLGPWFALATVLGLVIAYPYWIKAKIVRRMASINSKELRNFTIRRLIVSVKTVGFYIKLCILPGRTLVVYPFLSGWGLTSEGNRRAYAIDRYFILGLISLSALAAGSFLLPNPLKQYALFILLSLIAVSNLIPATQTAADRYAGAINVFIMYFLAYGFLQFGPAGMAAGLALGLYYLTMLREALPMFKDINSYYDYHNYFYPDNTIVRKFKINWMLRSGDVLGAWEQCKAGLLRNPNDFSFLYQTAVVMAQMGDTKAFTEYLDRAEKNYYIDQEDAWRQHIADLRAQSKKSKSQSQNRLKPSDFARTLR